MPTQSTVRFKAPGSAPSMQRVESNVVPKSKSKVQITRLAPTSPKVPNLRKKRLKNRQKDAKLAAPSADPPKHLDSALNSEVVVCNLSQKTLGGVPSDWPELNFLPPDETKSSGAVTPDGKHGRNISAMLENPLSRGSPNAKNKAKRKTKSKTSKKSSPRGSDDASEVLETSSERVISICKSEIRTPPPSETSFDTLLSCICKVLGKEDGFYDLQITPVRTGGGEASLESEMHSLSESVPQNLQITEVVTAFDNYYDSPPPEAVFLSPAPSLTFQESIDGGDYGIASEDNIARMLFGELDLHLELENYLREMEGFAGNALQCNLYEDYYSSSMDLPNCTSEYLEVTEIRSNSSFASGTSSCAQHDGDANKPHLFLDGKCDRATVSEEHFHSKHKMFTSQTQLPDKLGGIRKSRSDNDPEKRQQEANLKSSTKRELGNTSYQSFRAEDEEKSWMLPPIRSDPPSENSVDSYEKILPFGWHWNRSDEMKRRNNVLYTNSVHSPTADSHPTAMRKAYSSNADGCSERREPVENVLSEKLSETCLSRKSSSDSMLSGVIQHLGKMPRKGMWSPSLQELIEIYNNVLKHNKKIRDELKEKEYKANLLMLSRNLNKKLKGPNMWKPAKQKQDTTLERYVTMFQEVLKSSLSINQITRLNNLISDLQEYSEKNYDLAKNMSTKRKGEQTRKGEVLVKEKTSPVPKEVRIKTSSVQTPKKRLRNRLSTTKEDKPPRSSSGRSQVRQKNIQNGKAKAEQLVPAEEMVKVNLTPPTELESILQSSLAAEGGDGVYPRDPEDKILVTVKLHGNQVLVSKLSYFKNEEALTAEKLQQNGTSQLIIENVTRDKAEDFGLKAQKGKKPKSGKSRELKKLPEPERPKSEISVHVEPKNIEPKKVEPKRAKKNKKPLQPATAPPTPKTAKKQRPIQTHHQGFLLSHTPEEPKTCLPFEYDQMQLRAQHPIEAIIESSESKLSEHVDSSDEENSPNYLEPPTAKTVLLKDLHKKTSLEVALKEALSENVYSKDLSCDFGWTDDQIPDMSLSRTKSYVINRETLKKQAFAQKPVGKAEVVRSMSDINNKPKARRKGRRKINAYLCYPSILNLQRKTSAVRKKSKKQPRQKNRSSYSRTPSDCTLFSQHQTVSKRSSKEFDSKIFISEVKTSQMSILNAVKEDLNRSAEKSRKDADVSDSDDTVLECCSMELLYHDKDDPSTSFTPKMSASMFKPTSKTIFSEPVTNNSSEGKTRNSIDSLSVTAMEGLKGSPTVIHPPRNHSEDTIFRSALIHSDSSLKKSSSTLPLAQYNLNSLLKSGSDMKFYPGRVCSSDKQQSPFIKFVLTPSQNADAGLPPSQVQVVDKKYTKEDDVQNLKTGLTQTPSSELNEKLTLTSIERFIKKLSRNKKKAKPKSMESPTSAHEDKEKPPSALKGSSKRKFPVSGQKTPAKTPERKPYHECQRRKLSDKAKAADKKPKAVARERKAGDKKSKTSDSKTKINKDKAAQEALPENSEMNILSLKNFIAVLSQMVESYQQSSRLLVLPKNQAEKNSEKEKAGGSTAPEGLDGEALGEGGTSTIPEQKCSLTRVPAVDGNTSGRKVLSFRSAVTQTEEAEGVSESQAGKHTAAEAVPSRKQKMLKIKIHCDDRNNPKGCSKSEQTGEKKTKSPVADMQPQLFVLLDSLVMGEPEGAGLERQNSRYFDAEDRLSEEENEGDRSEGKVDDSEQEFLAYWATVDTVELNGVAATEGKSDSRLPPRAERVFDEILNSLQEDRIYHSLTLLENFLRKMESSPSTWIDNPDRLRKVLLMMSKKSRNVMSGMERNAWLKVLSLLEEMSQMLGSEHVDSPNSAKAFAEKVFGLNDRRLVDLQNFCCSLQRLAAGNNSVFCRIKDYLNSLRNWVSGGRSASVRDSLLAGTADLSFQQCERHPLQELRKQIQRHKAYMEFLLSADCSAVPQNIQNVQGRVVEKLRTFGEILSMASGGRKETRLGRSPFPEIR